MANRIKTYIKYLVKIYVLNFIKMTQLNRYLKRVLKLNILLQIKSYKIDKSYNRGRCLVLGSLYLQNETPRVSGGVWLPR